MTWRLLAACVLVGIIGAGLFELGVVLARDLLFLHMVRRASEQQQQQQSRPSVPPAK